MKALSGIKDIKQVGAVDESKFFHGISSRCNYASDEAVKEFYSALVRTITAGLREHGIVRLPNIGDIALVRQKDKVGVAGTLRGVQIKDAYMIKFYPYNGLKLYFSQWTRTQQVVDPREKAKLKKKL